MESTLSTDPLPPPTYAEVQKKDRRHRIVKKIVVCCAVVVALAVGWCIPGPAYIRTMGNTEVYVTRTDWISQTNTREVWVTQTNTREVYITRTNWVKSSKCTTITRTIPQTVYVTSTQVQTVTRYVQPTPSPTENPVCPYTYPAGYKDGENGRSYGDWSPRFRTDQDYMKGYFEGFYNYYPYCVSNQLSS